MALLTYALHILCLVLAMNSFLWQTGEGAGSCNLAPSRFYACQKLIPKIPKVVKCNETRTINMEGCYTPYHRSRLFPLGGGSTHPVSWDSALDYCLARRWTLPPQQNAECDVLIFNDDRDVMGAASNLYLYTWKLQGSNYLTLYFAGFMAPAKQAIAVAGFIWCVEPPKKTCETGEIIFGVPVVGKLIVGFNEPVSAADSVCAQYGGKWLQTASDNCGTDLLALLSKTYLSGTSAKGFIYRIIGLQKYEVYNAETGQFTETSTNTDSDTIALFPLEVSICKEQIVCQPNPCHTGRCQARPQWGYECICLPGITGVNCETDIRYMPPANDCRTNHFLAETGCQNLNSNVGQAAGICASRGGVLPGPYIATSECVESALNKIGLSPSSTSVYYVRGDGLIFETALLPPTSAQPTLRFAVFCQYVKPVNTPRYSFAPTNVGLLRLPYSNASLACRALGLRLVQINNAYLLEGHPSVIMLYDDAEKTAAWVENFEGGTVGVLAVSNHVLKPSQDQDLAMALCERDRFGSHNCYGTAFTIVVPSWQSTIPNTTEYAFARNQCLQENLFLPFPNKLLASCVEQYKMQLGIREKDDIWYDNEVQNSQVKKHILCARAQPFQCSGDKDYSLVVPQQPNGVLELVDYDTAFKLCASGRYLMPQTPFSPACARKYRELLQLTGNYFSWEVNSGTVYMPGDTLSPAEGLGYVFCAQIESTDRTAIPNNLPYQVCNDEYVVFSPQVPVPVTSSQKDASSICNSRNLRNPSTYLASCVQGLRRQLGLVDKGKFVWLQPTTNNGLYYSGEEKMVGANSGGYVFCERRR